ncbi:MmcQ/YjbR family DNA-binding protein [Kangiella sp. TOML190]|uniref:MmcQ/YjbR family DNA-binding protein n=1 Tax=Kangiella sp. TOML190 TaxID=2931351 RepID=UPI0020401678|nr:MmcQ/YjbR family DNA-binding protein [Kangiella sp. TOML190]
MDSQQAKQYVLSKPEAIEDHPFGPDVAVFKVKGKMFATLALGDGKEKGTQGKMAGHWCMNLKCNPDHADAIRSTFTAVIPGYHMNKKHWNTLILDGTIPASEIEKLIDHSYSLVVKSLKKSERELLELHHSEKDLHQ